MDSYAASFTLQKSPETALEVANSKLFMGEHAPDPPSFERTYIRPHSLLIPDGLSTI